MVRVRKRGHQEERLVAIASGVAVEPFAAFVSDIGGWIKLLRNCCPERLRANVIVRQLVRTTTQRIGVRPPRVQPHVIVPTNLIPVSGAEINVLKAVERKLQRKIVPGLPALRVFLVVGSLEGGLARLGKT